MWVKTALAPWVMIAVTFLVTSKSTCNHSLGLLLWEKTDRLQPFSSNEKDKFIAAEAKLALHVDLGITCPPYQASGWSCWVLNQAACPVHVAVHAPRAAPAGRGCKHPASLLGSHLLARAPAACPAIFLHGLPLASTRWSSPAGSGGPGRVTSWRRHCCCRRTQRCAGQGSFCSPFLGAWSSLEERSGAC